MKPALSGDEPTDIYNYSQTNQGFPHESTSDQWFSESQFESYRMLGSLIQQMCMKDWDDRWTRDVATGKQPPLEFFKTQVEQYLNLTSDQTSEPKPSPDGAGTPVAETAQTDSKPMKA